jgi:16S rRNA (adenine1518-N6/adenine1519-N6)-dimethyltransferase
MSRARPAPHAPRKRFGQHFLTDRSALQRIVEALAPTAADTVVEIGPGRGALTDLLAERSGKVVAIEIDRDLVVALRARYAERSNILIVEGDVLAVDLAALAGGPFLLVGNLPYNITTPILFHALVPPRPTRLVFLVQREVAERLAAPPGSSPYGALTVNATALTRVELIGTVGAGAFTPRPAVESAIVRLTPLPEPRCEPAEEAPLRSLVVALFGQRRRQMVRALRTVSAATLSVEEARHLLEAAAIDPAARCETLAPADFVRLLRQLRTSAASSDPTDPTPDTQT